MILAQDKEKSVNLKSLIKNTLLSFCWHFSIILFQKGNGTAVLELFTGHMPILMPQ